MASEYRLAWQMTGPITSQTLPPTLAGAVTRFAPSPTGRLHLGHALSALTGFHLAQRLGGRFLVRIEDIDPERCRPELIPEMLDLLRWLGISWDEPVLRQSQQTATYVAAARRLADMGLLYPCFASRSEIEAAGKAGATDPDGAPLYPGLHKDMTAAEVERRRTAGELFAMRIDMDQAITTARSMAGADAFSFTEIDYELQPHRIHADPSVWGDAVIQRKLAPTSYHLSVVVDDARQGVTLVTRGADLKAATGIQRLLQILLGLPEPRYLHHALVMGADGKKLSKRDNATSLAALREQGVSAREIRQRLGF